MEATDVNAMNDECDEEQKEEAIYLFEHMKFTPSGRRGVASLNVPTLLFLCQVYLPDFDETIMRRLTKRKLVEKLHERVRYSPLLSFSNLIV